MAFTKPAIGVDWANHAAILVSEWEVDHAKENGF